MVGFGIKFMQYSEVSWFFNSEKNVSQITLYKSSNIFFLPQIVRRSKWQTYIFKSQNVRLENIVIKSVMSHFAALLLTLLVINPFLVIIFLY